jgi:hypothetical protein
MNISFVNPLKNFGESRCRLEAPESGGGHAQELRLDLLLERRKLFHKLVDPSTELVHLIAELIHPDVQ